MNEKKYQTRYILIFSIFTFICLIWTAGSSENAINLQRLLFAGGTLEVLFTLITVFCVWGINLVITSNNDFVLTKYIFLKKTIPINRIYALERTFNWYNHEMYVHYTDSQGEAKWVRVILELFKEKDVADFTQRLLKQNPNIKLDSYFQKLSKNVLTGGW